MSNLNKLEIQKCIKAEHKIWMQKKFTKILDNIISHRTGIKNKIEWTQIWVLKECPQLTLTSQIELKKLLKEPSYIATIKDTR